MSEAKITLGGSVQSALWHFCGYGLAAMLEEAGCGDVRLWWQDSAPARLVISGATKKEADRIVRAHAQRAMGPGHWVQARLSNGPRAGIALFSPRVKGAEDRADWAAYLREREAAIDALDSPLDEAMITSLGGPAHWRETQRDRNPDAGASRWEMKTRNRGEEFVSHRLTPLAEVVAKRGEGGISDGLTGRALVDELGGDQSRTPTGFTLPRETDSAVAWLALWGISWFPLAHSASRVSATACANPSQATHPTDLVLPVFSEPTLPAKWRAILRSRYLPEACFAGDVSARKWLIEQGVVATVQFPIRKAGSASAPERQILDGQVVVLLP